MRARFWVLWVVVISCTGRVGFERPQEVGTSDSTDTDADLVGGDARAADPGAGDGGDSGTDTPDCITSAECLDVDACTEDLCDNGVCTHTAMADGRACDDGVACTPTSTCQVGVCVGHGPDIDNDTYIDEMCGGDDCDDLEVGINPGVSEGPPGGVLCNNGHDDDCDGFIDALDSGCVDATFTELTSTPPPFYRPSLFANHLFLGDLLYYVGDDPVLGSELWVTDGTPGGTHLVAEINPTGDADPTNMIALGSGFCFFADDGVHGRELWCSDGTEAGTAMVSDINPSAGSGMFCLEFVVVNGRVLFIANDGTHGAELWASDGTASGTQLLADIYPGATGSSPQNMIQLNSSVAIFNALDPVNGIELWRTDGTPAGTALIVDSNPGSANSLEGGWFRYFYRYNGSVYYRNDDGTHGLELWRTDGTALGTAIVKDILPGSGGGGFDSTSRNVAAGLLYFQANDGVTGREPYVTDGTEAGTRLLSDINPSGDSLAGNEYYEATEFGDWVYLRADDGISGIEWWRTDGTAAGTSLFVDILPGGSSDPYPLTIFRGILYFTATDGIAGVELWRTDGTVAGTYLAQDLNPGAASSYPEVWAQGPDYLIIEGTGPGGETLWRME